MERWWAQYRTTYGHEMVRLGIPTRAALDAFGPVLYTPLGLEDVRRMVFTAQEMTMEQVFACFLDDNSRTARRIMYPTEWTVLCMERLAKGTGANVADYIELLHKLFLRRDIGIEQHRIRTGDGKTVLSTRRGSKRVFSYMRRFSQEEEHTILSMALAVDGIVLVIDASGGDMMVVNSPAFKYRAMNLQPPAVLAPRGLYAVIGYGPVTRRGYAHVIIKQQQPQPGPCPLSSAPLPRRRRSRRPPKFQRRRRAAARQ